MKTLLLLNEEEFKKATEGMEVIEYETVKYEGTTFTFVEVVGEKTSWFVKVKPKRQKPYYVQQDEHVFLALNQLLLKA